MFKQCSKLKKIKGGIKLNHISTRSISLSFDITSLHNNYAKGTETIADVVKRSHSRIGKDVGSWIFKVPMEHVEVQARKQDEILKKASSFEEILQKYPLFGIPFGVKDNIDVAGFPTTAACPAFSRTPWVTSPVVDQLVKAGAILMGKQNMDQFAAGLVGVRSPYGTPVNPFNPKYCPGGSSSGSGVSTSTHQVSFSMGTDTAGSGRVPASFNNIVGLKPTPRVLSTRGLVPACRTLDCISVFALTADDAWKVFNQCNAYDHLDEYARPAQNAPFHSADRPLRFGFPKGDGLKFFGDTTGTYEAYFDAHRVLAEGLGAEMVPIDFTPFVEVARILYDGPWVAERLSALLDFYGTNKDDIHPVTRGILTKGFQYNAVQTFLGMRRLEKLRREAHEVWDDNKIDAFIVPTASVTPTIQEILQVPVGINTVLGLYTNFVNLLDLCGMAVPNTFLPSGMPTGITIIGKAFDDHFCYQVGRWFQSARNLPLGATEFTLPAKSQNVKALELLHEYIDLAVCGAHMEGLPLNKQLLELGGTLVKATQTIPEYNLFDISSPGLQRPGMIRTADSGASIDVEVWRIPRLRASDFLEKVKAPLVLGTVQLTDGTAVKGFLCENYVAGKAKDITSFGGWRSYLKSK
jgi:allophanate hydrolase